MCYHPISIRPSGNDNYVDNDGFIHRYHHGFRIDVPCGHCEQCLQVKRDSYVVRTESEFSRSKFACFLTLTYDNRHLPKYKQISSPVWSPDGDLLARPKVYNRSVWDKSHVQSFLKQLNERIIYYVGSSVLGLSRLVKKSDGTYTRFVTDEWKSFTAQFGRPLKYLCVCERGKNDIYYDPRGNKRRGTSRPHYHLILLFNTDYITPSFVHSLVNELWEYGLCYNVLLGDNHDRNHMTRDVAKSIRYICKYVTKDLHDSSSRLLYRSHDDYLRHSPFTLISNGYGDNLLDKYDDDSLLYHLVNGVTISGTDTQPERVVSVPLYNLRKSPCFASLDFGRVLSQRCPSEEFVVDLNYAFPVEHHPDDYEYSISHRVKFYMTDFGLKVKQLKRQKYVSDSLSLLKYIRSHPSFVDFLASSIFSTGCFRYVDDLMNVRLSDFEQFLYSPFQFDSGDVSNPLYLAYITFNACRFSYSKYQRHMRNLKNQLSLEKSLISKPELLCLQPL